MSEWAQYESNSKFDDIDEMMEPIGDVPEEEVDKPDASLLDKKRRKPNAVKYEKKIKKTLGLITRVGFSRPATVPDSAALLLYGPKFAEAWGDFAAENDGVSKAIDLLEAGTDSASLAIITATLPLVLQILRNHEPVLEPKPREFNIRGLGRKIVLPKFGIRLGLFRAFAHDPDTVVEYVLNDTEIIAALKKNGIHLATGDAS